MEKANRNAIDKTEPFFVTSCAYAVNAIGKTVLYCIIIPLRQKTLIIPLQYYRRDSDVILAVKVANLGGDEDYKENRQYENNKRG